MSKPASHTHIATSEHVDLMVDELEQVQNEDNPYVDDSEDDFVEWQQEMNANDELNTNGLCVWRHSM